MSSDDREKTTRLERATAAVQQSEPSGAEVEQAAERVWRRLAGEPAAAAAPEVIRGCEDFRLMIAAYREGTLAAARRELFADHVRSCVACRRALWRAEEAAPERPVLAGWSGWRRWAAVAAVVAIGAVAMYVGTFDTFFLSPESARTTAAMVDGSLLRLGGGQLAAVRTGETVAAGQPVRTGQGARAVLLLADGSRVEMNELSELAVEPRRGGTAIALRRGSVIVEAARQADGRRLLVEAPDCQVAVKGTVFAVSHGPKGSRVSVLEGEVWVEQDDAVTKLASGGQTVTRPDLTAVALSEEVAWSSDPERYAALLHAIREVGRTVAAKAATVPVRHDSRLLPLLSADTFVFATAPNLSGELASAGEDLIRRIQADPRLAAWFAQYRQQSPEAPDMLEALRRFRDLGAHWGDEIVLAVSGDAAGKHPSLMLLTEASDPAGLRAAIEAEVQRIGSQCGEPLPVVVVQDPLALAGVPEKALIVLLHRGIAAASDDAGALAGLAARLAGAPSEFAATPFHAQLARCYQEGVTWLLASDLQRLASGSGAAAGDAGEAAVAEALGLRDLRYFIAEHKTVAGQSVLRGVLAFERERRGIADWLGAPAPMGALEFVSPNAYFAGCLLAKQPKQIADEVLGVLARHDPEGLGELLAFERENGVSVAEDLAAPLGGELLLAVDGPVLPTPAWKAAVLVTDQARLQQTLERLLAVLNRRLAAEGRPPVAITSTSEDGAQLYTVAQAEAGVGLAYTFWDGYWLLAANRAMLTDALRTRRSGITLAASAAFRDALPADGAQQYSAIAFVNASSLAATLASVVPSGGEGQTRAGLDELRSLLAEAPAMAFCATAERDRIVVTSSGIDLARPGELLAAFARMRGAALPAFGKPGAGSRQES